MWQLGNLELQYLPENMPEMAWEDVLLLIVQSIIAFFGIFGHSQIFIATWKKKSIQTKYGLLLLQLSVAHLFCIIGELTNTVLIVCPRQTSQMTCFLILSQYIFFEVVQAVLMLSISLDLLLAIAAPMFYREMNVQRSIILSALASCLAAGIYGTVFVCLLSPSKTLLCSMQSIRAAQLLSTSHNVIHFLLGVAQIACYGASYLTEFVRGIMFQRANPTACYRNRFRKSLRTISVLITIYLLTWFASIIIDEAAYRMTTPSVIAPLRASTGILQMLTFSQCFYVSIWRSSEYRNVVKKMWKGWMSKILPKWCSDCIVKCKRNKIKPSTVTTIQQTTQIKQPK